ncbi:MAG: hypothetical protein AB1420_12790 [Bacillota bacterium]
MIGISGYGDFTKERQEWLIKPSFVKTVGGEKESAEVLITTAIHNYVCHK